jgi:hypothetical protein
MLPFGSTKGCFPKRATRLVAAIVATVGPSTMGSASAATICGIEAATFESLEATIKSTPGVTVLPSDGSVVSYRDAKTQIIWNFSTKSSPAFPSVACRFLEQVDGAFRVKTNVVCGAAKTVCDRLVAAYDELDRKMTAAAKKQE